METSLAHYDAIELTENHVRQLHRDLLQYADKDERYRGEYKTLDNHVGAFGPDGESFGIVFETTSPVETPVQMEALVAWTRNTLAQGELHPLIVTGVFVVFFLAIHPFQEGNGRLSRTLTTLLLLRSGYEYPLPMRPHLRLLPEIVPFRQAESDFKVYSLTSCNSCTFSRVLSCVFKRLLSGMHDDILRLLALLPKKNQARAM